VMAAVARHFAARDSVRVVDLGCGAGSNLRGTFAHLPDRQKWTLVDYDARLLDAARATLAGWADQAREIPDGLVLEKAGKILVVGFRQADLSAGVAPVLDAFPDLVTAAALFDLVAADWIARFARDLAARGLPFLTVLTYDGRTVWSPPHAEDARVLDAFNEDMRRDKGFGPAAGGEATAALVAAFAAQGYATMTGDSPWRLARPADARLIDELARGIASAAAASPDWLAARLAAQTCVIGHTDVFATPQQ
jgi:SAM-dependent methyltransferase